MTELLRKLKNEKKMNSAMNRNIFPNDEEKYIESTGILKDTPGVSNLVTCELEPSSFRMDDHVNDKTNRRDSEDSLLKFAIHFLKESDNNSPSGESDTTSSRHHHPYKDTILRQDLPTSEYSDSGTGCENMDNETNNQNNRDQANDQLINDTLNVIGQVSPATNESSESGQSDTKNDKADESDDKSSSSEDGQSFSSSPRLSNGTNSHNHGLRQRRFNRSRDHVTIEIEEENEKEHFQTPTGLLESYLYIMQFLGISAFRRIEYQSLNMGFAVLLKVIFWVVSTCAFLESLRVLKRVALEDAPTDKDMKYCVEVGFEMIRCFGRFFFIELAGTQTDKLAVMLLHIRNLRLFANDGEFSFSMLSLFLTMTTLVFTITKVFFGYLYFDEWTWNGSLQTRAFVLATSLFSWTSNENITDALADEYLYQDPTMKHIVMGFIEGFLDFCGTFQGEAIRDLLILAGLTILIDQRIFEQRIQPQLLVHPNGTDPVEVEGSLRHFKCVNQESVSINDNLVTPFKFIIVQNLLLYAHLFIQLIEYEGMSMVLIHSTVDGLKGLVLFYIGMRLHWKNSNIKKWLNLMSSYTGPVDVEVILGMSVQTGIADLRDNPIGLGSDYFLINETFMVGLFASVGSLITLIFQFDKQEATLRRLVL